MFVIATLITVFNYVRCMTFTAVLQFIKVYVLSYAH